MQPRLSEPVAIREAMLSDLTAITALIHRTIRRSNSPDYSADEIERIIDILSSTHLAKQFSQLTVLIATIDKDIVGTASLSGDCRRAHLVFVDPDRQGEGLGKHLLDEIERLAIAAGTSALVVHASRTAVGFYVARGYVVDGPESSREFATLPMVKRLAKNAVTPP